MNKWHQFRGKSFKIVNLGRPAVFLIPAKKLNGKTGHRVRANLHQFLISQFGGYTTSLNPSFGIYTDSIDRTVPDQCIEYEVSFDGKDKIPTLLKKLAELAASLKEECLYLKAGQYSCLVYPRTMPDK